MEGIRSLLVPLLSPLSPSTRTKPILDAQGRTVTGSIAAHEPLLLALYKAVPCTDSRTGPPPECPSKHRLVHILRAVRISRRCSASLASLSWPAEAGCV